MIDKRPITPEQVEVMLALTSYIPSAPWEVERLRAERNAYRNLSGVELEGELARIRGERTT